MTTVFRPRNTGARRGRQSHRLISLVREGSFASVPALVAEMEGYLRERKLRPRRYGWNRASRCWWKNYERRAAE